MLMTAGMKGRPCRKYRADDLEAKKGADEAQGNANKQSSGAQLSHTHTRSLSGEENQSSRTCNTPPELACGHLLHPTSCIASLTCFGFCFKNGIEWGKMFFYSSFCDSLPHFLPPSSLSFF